MNLSKKTFIYSFILSGGIVTLIIIYFVVMLPSVVTCSQKISIY